MKLRLRRHLCVAVLAVVAASCGDSSGDAADGTGDTTEPVTITLLTHDSFAVSDDVLDAFSDETGIEVELLQGGDAGTMVNQAILTKDNPQADVLFGIDSTFLTRGLDEDLFVPYEAQALDTVDDGLLADDEHRVTPIDYGDVCLNYDKVWFEDADLPVPERLEDLTDARYRDLLVVENPATSSPGLAFLLASIEAFGDDGWEDWWADLRANGVEVADDWEVAYYSTFSGGAASEGTRPLVVSYASSPPAEVVYADPPITDPPTGVIDDSCYRQVEYAGILSGTEHEEEAGKLLDFMLSPRFQEDVPLSMFVFPAVSGTPLPSVFAEHAAQPAQVFELPPADITAHREEWIDRWTDVVLR